MPVYNAPEIKDRVATGDDLYMITDVDGKKKLTPSPTEVSEPGTAINKALLQGVVDALQTITGSFVPYDLYWWRRRPSANSYVETQQTAFVSSNPAVGYYSSIIPFFYHGENADFNSSVSFQTASSITINQSTGAVSLKNPTSRTVKYADYNATTLNNMCAGKYIKFTSDYSGASLDEIMYVPSEAYIRSYSVASSTTAPTRGYIGYLSPTGNWGGWGPGTDVKLIGSVKQTAIGDWELISSDASDTYPHSGVSDGYEYVYYGQIYSYVLDPPEDNSMALKTVNITSASYSSNKYSVDVPGNICAFAMSDNSYYTQQVGEIIGIIDKASGYVWYCGNEDINGYSRTAAMVHVGNNVSIEYNEYSSGSNLTRIIAKYSNGKLLFGYGNTGDDNNFKYTGTVYLLPLK